MFLTQEEIELLLEQQPITDQWPWNTGDEDVVHPHIKDVVAEVRRKNRLLDQSEFDHYGSGYASFVDCWLYREDDAFRFAAGDCYWGMVVLFSTLSYYYVIGEGQKTWEKTSGSSYLPDLEMVDQLTHPAIQEIADNVCAVLDDRGLVRLRADDLSTLLACDVSIPTILGDPPFREFDALFYWED